MVPDGLLDVFYLNVGSVVVDFSAEATCFPNVMFRANLATDDMDAVVCSTRCVAQYFVGTTFNGAYKTVRVVAMLAHRHLASEQAITYIFLEYNLFRIYFL